MCGRIPLRDGSRMKIRFLQTTPSDNPEYPFMAGQVITVAQPTPSLLRLIDDEHAEIVREDAIERAVVAPDPTPEPLRKKGRRKRVLAVR